MFKKKFNFETRLAESTRIRKAYPDRVPLIIQRAQNSKDVEDLKKHKYLVPAGTSIAQLIAIIRKRMTGLPAEKSIFIFVNETSMPSANATLAEVDNSHRDKDGFVYVHYAGENVFG